MKYGKFQIKVQVIKIEVQVQNPDLALNLITWTFRSSPDLKLVLKRIVGVDKNVSKFSRFLKYITFINLKNQFKDVIVVL
ncbi:hypothetical protein BpHYR1_033245 [Brachionus plicatilis]|uniref:Uncharacterized protein n=1 Tax=Brachionus plicatilis TaxID=10195 RepID=A0A3M7PGE8_BRAPC|nr:hypothetical protein BpHYR1_033245 [Brachionus plicatilis]